MVGHGGSQGCAEGAIALWCGIRGLRVVGQQSSLLAGVRWSYC
jgi:hypothetical protein